MANTYYDSQLTAAEIEAALEAIDGVIVPANNGKVLAIENGAIVAKSVTEYTETAVLEPLSVTANGDYTPGAGVDGFNSVHVAVPGSQPNLQSKTATQNGTVTPDAGYDGLSQVVVNVSGGGGETEPALPSAYQRVEYLDFTPSIGIVVTLPTSGTVLYTCEFVCENSTIAESIVFGYRLSSSNAKDFEVGTDSYGSVIMSWIRSAGANGIGIGGGNSCTIGTRVTAKIILTAPRSTALVGKYAHYTASSVDDIAFDGKFYSLKGVYMDTDQTAAWFVPCYRKADNQVGVYDHIAQAFYYETYAVGSGYSIVAGPDVS